MTELLRSDDEEQPDDQVNDGKAGKESCQRTHDVMENGQELEVFIVQNLLLVLLRIVHAPED